MRTLNPSGLCRGGQTAQMKRRPAAAVPLGNRRFQLGAVRLAPPLDVERAGGPPNRCLKHREKSDDEEKPQASAIAVSDGRARAWAIITSAFSSRSRFTNSASVAPTRTWNTRWKWNGESSAARARSAQPQRLVEMADDVVDGEVDPLDVRHRGRGAGFRASSQDLASPPAAICIRCHHDCDSVPMTRSRHDVSSADAVSSSPRRPPQTPRAATGPASGDRQMQLGNFSVSLAVKDIAASRAFYEKLGFRDRRRRGQNWLILQNSTSTIGLFQGSSRRTS